jgi:hypothetical protein
MNLRRALALALTAALLVPFARSAFAEDAKDAAAAAAAPKEAAPKKEGAKTKKKGAKGKKKAPVESKYKSTALSENSDVHYRFDEKGEPVGGKKKPAAKAKKKSSSSEDSEEKPACTEDAPCADKKTSDADSL